MKLYLARSLRAIVIVALAVVNGAPVYGKKKEPPAPAEPTSVKLSAQVPSLAALAETPQSQTKSGLRITMTPESYQAKDTMIDEVRRVPPPTHWGMVVMPSATAVYVERTKVPSLAVSPDRLMLHVHLSNQMPRVFRGFGIAVQFNVAGKLAAVDPSGYGDLVNAILPPRSEQEVTIYGPPISTIPAPCTVGVFFYDVVTNMDQAGNVTEKQNFEWYFSYQTQLVEKEFSVPPPERGWEEPRGRQVKVAR
jgi:hypothetical protein